MWTSAIETRSNLTIKPNEGLGCLRFGILPKEVEEHLGRANLTGEHSDPAPELGFGWYYSKLCLDVFFHRPGLLAGPLRSNGPFQLVMFTSSHRNLTLWGNRILRLPEREVLAILAGHGEHRFQPLERQATGKVLRILDLNLDLNFERGRLVRCQWRWVPQPESLAPGPQSL